MNRLALRPLAGLAAALVLVAPACARKYQAEQDGKDVGQALCDIRDADTPEDAKNAAEDLSKQISEDITVIRRSLENVRHDLGDTGQATVDGAFEGMDDCIDG